MIGDRVVKLEQFFEIKKPNEINYIEWLEELYNMQLEWEEKNQREFPI